MASVKCFKCGRANNDENITCEDCGEKLLRGQEYEEKIQELKDYEDFRKKYGLLGIILAILILLLLYPVLKWLFWVILSLVGTDFLPVVIDEYILKYVVLIFIFLILLIAVLPIIFGRWKIWCRYRWTRERMQCLDRETKNFFRTNIQGVEEAKTPDRKIQGPPVILLIIVFTLAGLVCVNKYTDFKPLDAITSLFGTSGTSGTSGTGTAQKVSGRYECHYENKNLGGGVARSEQTWAFVFRSDGTYISYLDGHQQYSGKWSQTGNTLTINVPAIPNLKKAYSFEATVSRNGNSITIGERKYIKVK